MTDTQSRYEAVQGKASSAPTATTPSPSKRSQQPKIKTPETTGTPTLPSIPTGDPMAMGLLGAAHKRIMEAMAPSYLDGLVSGTIEPKNDFERQIADQVRQAELQAKDYEFRRSLPVFAEVSDEGDWIIDFSVPTTGISLPQLPTLGTPKQLKAAS